MYKDELCRFFTWACSWNLIGNISLILFYLQNDVRTEQSKIWLTRIQAPEEYLLFLGTYNMYNSNFSIFYLPFF